MKLRKTLLVSLLILLFATLVSYGQDSTATAEKAPEKPKSPWKFSGNTSLTFTQIALSNWVAGGQNSIAGQATSYLQLDFKKDNHSWVTSLDLGFGVQKQADIDYLLKNLDKMDFNSQYGYYIGKYWYISSLLGIKSQFAPGYPDVKHEKKTSDIFSPLYVTLALGADFKPDDHFSMLLSPLTGRLTYVRSQMLASEKAFGVDPLSKRRWELGAYIKFIYINRFFDDKFGINSKLELFTNYLEKPENVDVNFNLVLDYKLLSFLTAQFQLAMIYDDNQIGELQVREMLGIGLAYTF